MPYTCHLCADAEPATVLITPLQGGDTMAIGPDCMVTGLCGLLSVATQTDAEALYDAIIQLRQARDDAAAALTDAANDGTSGLHQHDSYVPHSHEVRPDHRGVKRSKPDSGAGTRADPGEVPESGSTPA